MTWESFRLHVNPLTGAAMISVLHDITRCLIDGQLEGAGASFIERRTWKSSAKATHEFTSPAKMAQIAADLNLRPRDWQLHFFYSNRYGC